jgi:hypothetical protein
LWIIRQNIVICMDNLGKPISDLVKVIYVRCSIVGCYYRNLIKHLVRSCFLLLFSSCLSFNDYDLTILLMLTLGISSGIQEAVNILLETFSIYYFCLLWSSIYNVQLYHISLYCFREQLKLSSWDKTLWTNTTIQNKLKKITGYKLQINRILS